MAVSQPLRIHRPLWPQNLPFLLWQACLKSQSPATLAQNVVRIMQQVQTCHVISKHIEALIQTTLRSAMSVVSVTFPCRPYQCTSWLTISVTNAMYAAKPSQDRGCCRVIWGRIQETSPMDVPTVVNVLLIVPTSENICKHIRLSRISNASAVTSHLPSSPIWTSIMSQPVSKINQFRIFLIHHPVLQPLQNLELIPTVWPHLEVHPDVLVWPPWIIVVTVINTTQQMSLASDPYCLFFQTHHNNQFWECKTCLDMSDHVFLIFKTAILKPKRPYLLGIMILYII